MSAELKSYLLRPLDTLFFRSGQPFNAGEDHYVSSLFPPTPRTMQGIVRTRLLAQANIDLTDTAAIESTVGKGDNLPPDLQFKGPYPFKGKPYFPIPRYLVYDPSGHKQLEAVAGFLSDLGNGYHLPALPGADPPGYVPKWVPRSRMRKLLWEEGPSRALSGEIEDSLWKEEMRTGIARDRKKGTARKEHLYSMGHIRLERETEGLWFQSTRSVEPGLMAVGGEGRLASFEEASEPDMRLPDDIAQAICTDKKFWLVLVQPARLEQGHLPDISDEPWSSLKARCITCVVGKPLSIGGFDLVKKRPADMYRYVPVGSSYLIEISGPVPSDAATILQKIHNTCCLGDEKERPMGFGHVMIGRVRSRKEKKA